jgi:hypothetical protein
MGPIMGFIFKSHTFLRQISMHAIDNCLKLKLSGIGSSTLGLKSCLEIRCSIVIHIIILILSRIVKYDMLPLI